MTEDVKSENTEVPAYLTLTEAARLLRLSPSTLYQNHWPERLGAVKIGRTWRVRRAAVIGLLEGNP